MTLKMLFITLYYSGKIAVVIFYSSKVETDIINETKITVLITMHVFVPSFVNLGQSAHAMIFFVSIRPSAPRSQSAELRCKKGLFVFLCSVSFGWLFQVTLACACGCIIGAASTLTLETTALFCIPVTYSNTDIPISKQRMEV